ncbi:MAG: Xaa-Pro peptidase family protein [Firmicutes bacterium]|nr:Xaa-Pro peptidase family protein [Bacillota bacterium]
MAFLSPAVFEWRHEKIRAYCAENGLAGVAVTTPENFYLVSGYHLDVAPWERPVAAVIPAQGDPFLVMNELSTHHLRMASERGTLFVKDYDIYTEHMRMENRTYIVSQWTKLLARKLLSRGIRVGLLGVEGGSAALTRLKEDLPDIETVNVNPLFVELRQIKHPEELATMRLAAQFTDWAQDIYMKTIKPGMLVMELDFEVSRLMAVEAANRFPADRVEIRLMSLSGPASASPHGTGADAAARVEKGHGVVNIIIVRLNGLVVENERTLFMGPPGDLQRRAFEAASEANLAAAEKMVAGNIVAEADAAAQRVIERAGFGQNIFHRSGHGMGIAGHEFPADMPFNFRPFMENEVYSAEPGIYIWGVGGFRHDDTVIIGRDKPEVITHRSKRLEDQIVPV